MKKILAFLKGLTTVRMGAIWWIFLILSFFQGWRMVGGFVGISFIVIIFVMLFDPRFEKAEWRK